jgi:DNA-binding MarR family transcriptional regulator
MTLSAEPGLLADLPPARLYDCHTRGQDRFMSQRKRSDAAAKAGGAGLDYLLAEQPGHLLRRCQQRAVDIFMDEVAPNRITPRQYAILVTLSRQPGLTQTELVGVTGIDRSTVGEMIDRLVRRGFVRRQKSGSDQRANTLVLLPAGKAMLRSVRPAVDRAQVRIMEPLPPALRRDVLEGLRRLAAADDSVQRQSDD